MKDKIFAVLQRVGRSFMLPIAILPVAGLLLGIGGSFTNPTMIEAYGLNAILGEGTVLNAVLTVMSQCGDIIFGNLPIIFAMGVAIGMAKKEKEVAALSGAIAFFVMHTAISAMLSITGIGSSLPNGSITSVVGIESLQMGVFGGIIVGLGVAYLHNKFYKIELPQVLSFFGGTRFVPIISALTYVVVGIVMFFVWPYIQNGIYAVGAVVRNAGYGGTFLYGLMERALIPFGLHHVFYIPFWQTAVGGTAEIGGVLVEGAQNIFFAQLADPSTTLFSVEATRFMSGKFPLMIFGLPGAALAMYQCAKPEKRQIAGGLLLSAALTSMLTGITEPLEFTFLFVAPVLYVIHSIFAGAAYMLMHIFNVGVGMTFSGGFIDLALFGILQGNTKTNWIWVIIIGAVYFVVYYLVFTLLIKKFNYKTPGREDENEETKLYTRADVNAKNDAAKGVNDDSLSTMIVKGLGGLDNISDIDACATRLRVSVHEASKVDETILKATNAAGVVFKGNGVQIIYGPRVSVIKSNLEDYIANPSAHKEEELIIEEKEIKEVSDIFVAPLSGEMKLISETPDESFSQKMMGDGVVIFPTDNTVVSPCDGVIKMIFPTKHAIGIESKEGVEILIHVGIDTVLLNGEGFETLVKEMEEVKKGQSLLRFDLDYVKKNAKSDATVVVFTNLQNDSKLSLMTLGDVKANQEIIKVS
ncbi:MAG: PTS transporter subunit EIIC [Erysipelotrichales bacterium]|nr:PTS transporter subunit EIIC [Erysipelotrichales bacterium]